MQGKAFNIFILSYYEYINIGILRFYYDFRHLILFLCFTVFDREWKAGLPLADGLEIIRKCLHELRTRFLISQPVFVIKIVDKNGTRSVSL